jgi:hypothetical protein
LRQELHEQARNNLRRFASPRTCKIQSIATDATEYVFPEEDLVLFFFNPFGTEVMSQVLSNLDASLRKKPRDIWVILHDSVCSDLADAHPSLKLIEAHYGYRIYRNIPPHA